MLSPKKTKWRKQMKQVRHLRGTETRGAKISYGDWGIRALESGWVTNRQIEAGRVAISRVLKKGGKVWIRIFPDKPLTKKPAETRMGSGKGSPEQWVAEVRAGRLMYEIGGVDEASAKKALARCSAKLPLQSKIVGRTNYLLSA